LEPWIHGLQQAGVRGIQQIKALAQVDVSPKNGWRLNFRRIALFLFHSPIVSALRAVLPKINPRSKPVMLLLFRFTKIWEKIIVIMGEEWTEGIVIGQERVEPRLA